MSQSEILNIKLNFQELASRGRIGLVLLATDYNTEDELHQYVPAGYKIYTNRVFNLNPLTIANLQAMEVDLERAIGGILPDAGIDLLIYACTSGTIAIGEKKIAAYIKKKQGNIPFVNPASAVIQAIKSLSYQSISILTPYTDEINAAFLPFFVKNAITVEQVTGLGMVNDCEISCLTKETIFEAVEKAIHAHCKVLFISCTSFHLLSYIKELEEKFKIIILTSNQVLIWHSLRLLDDQTNMDQLGTLFSYPLLENLVDKTGA